MAACMVTCVGLQCVTVVHVFPGQVHFLVISSIHVLQSK